MNHRYFQQISAQFLLIAIAINLSAKTADASVAINEVFWMGSDLSTADEWVEIIASGSGSIDITNWSLTTMNGAGLEETMIRFNSGSVLQPNTPFVLSNYAEPQSRLSIIPDRVTTAVSLPNTKLLLRLRDASGSIVDTADDGAGEPFAGFNGSGPWLKASMERIDPLQSGSDTTNWRSATTTIGFDSGALLLGTPGFLNGSGNPPPLADPPTASGSHSSLQLSEILSDPLGSDTEEWIELRNTSSGSLNLHGTYLTVGSRQFELSSLSGATLGSGGYLTLLSSVSGLSLRNAGDTVSLFHNDTKIDQITYPALPDGISFGRGIDGIEQAFCVPTPDTENGSIAWQPELTIQSGTLKSEEKVTMNLAVIVAQGSLAGAVCTVNFGDGTITNSCNPASHTFKKPGVYTIQLTAMSYCSTTVLQSLIAEVLPGGASAIRSKKTVMKNACVPTGSGVIVSEVLPSPAKGTDEKDQEDEWIEIHNTLSTTVDMCGWSLDDEEGGSKPYQLERVTLRPKEYRSLPRLQTKITLNDSGDHVRLFSPMQIKTSTGTFLQPSAVLADSLAYGKATKGETFALREDGQFVWTPFLTPSEPNRFRDSMVKYGSESVLLSAIPNPAAENDRGEWLELRNMTDGTILFKDWVLKTQSKTALPYKFPYMFLKPGEGHRLYTSTLGMDLGNANGQLVLSDNNSHLVSVLKWGKAMNDHIYYSRNRELPLHKGIIKFIYSDKTIDIDIYDPEVREPEYERIRIRLADVEVENITDKYEFSKYVRSHSEGNKIDLLYYSNSGSIIDAQLVSKNRDSVATALIRDGKAFTSADAEPGRAEVLLHFQQEAMNAKLGLWSSDEKTKLVLDRQESARILKGVQQEGLKLSLSPNGPLIQSGTSIQLKTNYPADVFVSAGSGEFIQLQSGSLVFTHALDMKAYAQLKLPESQVASGTILPVSHILHRSLALLEKNYSKTVAISEIFPAPDASGKKPGGTHEWIEFHNRGLKPVNLLGWKIDDVPGSGSSIKTITEHLIVPPQGYLVFDTTPTRIALNNRGDAVNLYDPHGNLMNNISYGKIAKGISIQPLRKTKNRSICKSDVPTPGRPPFCYHFLPDKLAPDADSDGLSDERERFIYKTNSQSADSDNDHFPDGFEVAIFSNPLVSDAGSGSLQLAYESYVVKQLQPTWNLFKTKGLTFKVKKSSARGMAFVINKEKIAGSQLKSGIYEGIVTHSLLPGEYAIDIEVADILNTKIVLKNVLKIQLNEKYVYKSKTNSAKKVSKAKRKYVSVMKNQNMMEERDRSLRDRLSQQAQKEQVRVWWPFGFIVGSLLLGIFGIWLELKWLQKKR